MKAKPTYYLLKHRLSSVFMIIALIWLTVSTPVVFAAQISTGSSANHECNNQQEEECANPFGNTTEEKTEGGVNTLSEFLHELHFLEHGYVIIEKYEKCHADDLYFAYHPELISPPPDAVIA